MERIYGEGKPGARPCGWPDDAAPWDWDDPAVKSVRFFGAREAVPTCASCLETLRLDMREFTIEEVG